MREFKDLEELKTAFLAGSVRFDESEYHSIFVSDAEYRKHKSTNHSLEDMLCKGFKAFFVYTLRPNEENKEKEKAAGLHDWIIFLWGFDKKLRMLPYDVRSTTRSRATMAHLGEAFKEIDQSRIIPDRVKVMIIDLPVANELVGKVDTGADICSLHAENIDVDRANQKVSFDCPPLSSNRFTVPLADTQAVRTPSSQETTYRPVISVNLKVGDKGLKDIKVNLNDRSNMDQPFLVGQNALEAGNFIIDPNIIKDSEDLDDLFNTLTEATMSETVDQPTISAEDAAKVFDIFEGSDLTLDELIKVLRTEAINRLKDISY